MGLFEAFGHAGRRAREQTCPLVCLCSDAAGVTGTSPIAASVVAFSTTGDFTSEFPGA